MQMIRAAKTKRPLFTSQFSSINKYSILPLSQSFYSLLHNHYSTIACPLEQQSNVPVPEVVRTFKEWFKTNNYYRFKGRNSVLIGRIFEILSSQEEVDEVSLSHLNIPLSESLVLEFFKYCTSKNDVLSCIKFFDWAGRQSKFYHTRATFHALFKILSKADLVPLMMDFLDTSRKEWVINERTNCGFYQTLVLGYSVAGKPQIAMQLFGRMRFQGVDLDYITYHVLLNSLVEDCSFDAASTIAKQICFRGFESHVTHSIVVKSLCKQKLLGEAETYLRSVILRGETGNGYAVSVLVNELCHKGQFDKAGKLVKEFSELGVVPTYTFYSVWIQNLIQTGRVDMALEFLQQQSSISNVPEVLLYNSKLHKLLKEDQLIEVGDLLMEMKEGGVPPNKATMNAALCFFCKAGLVDVALDLYKCKSELALTPSAAACNILICSLCDEGKAAEAFHVFKNSREVGYFPGKRTFHELAGALCREGNLEMMKELISIALENKFVPASVYEKLISALCTAKKFEDGYLIHRQLNQMNRVARRTTYAKLIHGFSKIDKGEIAARLLIEMQNKGHKTIRPLFREVIQSLCNMENPEIRFFKFLEMQLSINEPNCEIYNFFIDGAGHAKKPDLARKVFELMRHNGIEPNLNTDILMLQSYMKNGRIYEAMQFFDALGQRKEHRRKLYNVMVVGLCKANSVKIAQTYFWKMKGNKLIPTVQSYEELIMHLCANGDYGGAIELIKDFERNGRRVTSFIGNILLLHSMRSDELYNVWLRVIKVEDGVSSELYLLGQIIGVFSDRLRLKKGVESLEEVIGQCFPLDIFTYNMLLRRLSVMNIDFAFKLFYKLRQKNYDPNQWTYDILVHGLFKHGRTEEARIWVDEMFRRGFKPTYVTRQLM